LSISVSNPQNNDIADARRLQMIVRPPDCPPCDKTLDVDLAQITSEMAIAYNGIAGRESVARCGDMKSVSKPLSAQGDHGATDSRTGSRAAGHRIDGRRE
jgi:hypothetical protein